MKDLRNVNHPINNARWISLLASKILLYLYYFHCAFIIFIDTHNNFIQNYSTVRQLLKNYCAFSFLPCLRLINYRTLRVAASEFTHKPHSNVTPPSDATAQVKSRSDVSQRITVEVGRSFSCANAGRVSISSESHDYLENTTIYLKISMWHIVKNVSRTLSNQLQCNSAVFTRPSWLSVVLKEDVLSV